ncbi:zinc ribbon protein [Natranaerovirga pectinivora]|uniref:Zinc ribbon protein n=1 Tax=Natranaerovirga pectinivora TaxID=682400 RepID=A0A4R3MPQ4_9FIRM|nr:zinc ribbon domain-containing protein [Natranaerovirga pectinivora]TCT14962.1 zinc ribbon protein [Natranaerovirga pectinivora]
MYCKNCGQPLDDKSVFCTHCGTKKDVKKMDKRNNELFYSRLKENFNFSQETVVMSLKITGVALGIMVFLSLIISIGYFYLVKSYGFFTPKFKIFDVYNIFNLSLFNKMELIHYSSQTIRILILLLIPILSIFIGYKLFYRKSELISRSLLCIFNGTMISLLNIILAVFITDPRGSYLTFFNFANTLILLTLLSYLTSLLIDKDGKAVLDTYILKIIKPIVIVSSIFVFIVISYSVFYLKDFINLTFILGLIVLLPNILVYVFLFFFGSGIAIEELRMHIIGLRIGSELYGSFAFLTVFLYLAIILLVFNEYYKMYQKNKDGYSYKAIKSICTIALGNLLLSFYSRQVFEYMRIVNNNDRMYIGVSPINAFLITLLFLSVISFFVYLLKDHSIPRVIQTTLGDFKLIFYIIITIIIMLSVWFGFNTIDATIKYLFGI